MNDQVKTALLNAKAVTNEQLAAAEARSAEGKSFDRALMEQAGLDKDHFFQKLEDVYGMPYINLEDLKIPPGARLVCPEICIRRWNIFPVDFSPKDGLITLAVGSPEHAERIDRIFRFLMEPYDIGFVFTEESELADAVARECGSGEHDGAGAASGAAPRQQVKASVQHEGGKRKIAIPLPKQKEPEKASAGPVQQPGPVKAARRGSSAEEHVSDELVKSLTSAVSLIVNAHIGTDPDALSSVKERVRYCQLTATRLALKPVEATKVILAAWLSALTGRRDVIKQFVCPYDLEEILFAEESGRGLGIEALILSLVKVYQEFERKSPDDARDVGLARRGLFMAWPMASKHQDVLETFLQVLMDEQYVEKLGKRSGRIVLFNPGGGTIPEVDHIFERSGYAVKNENVFDQLEPVVQANGADILILYASGDGKAALAACRSIKEAMLLSSVPLMVVIAERSSSRGADFLRAGADDFVAAPVDEELLLLKAEKLMSMPTRSQGKSGVSGSLADMSFSDLVQVLSAGGKSMDVSVTSDDQSGRIVLKAGNVVHAEAGELRGEQAFYALMQWKVGQFSMSECRQFPEPTVTASTMSLLMEGARIADEGAAPL